MPTVRDFRKLALFLTGATVVACAATHSQVDPRFLAVHNAFAAMGLSQVGPVQQGSLVEGRDARLPVELGAQCTTLVAMGNDGVRDIDLTLLDPAGNPIARDASHDAQAVVRACIDAPGTYTMLVHMASGSGEFLAATWAGGIGGAGPAGSANAVASNATGTCESPIPITAGTYTGNTARGEREHECTEARSDAREIVYRLDIPTQKRLVIDVDAHFDSVLYVRKEDCASEDAEVKCNDDAGNERTSRIDVVVEPGTYYVFVDGYSDGTGSYRMNVALQDVPTLADACRQARPLTTNGTVSGSTTNAYDHVHASCGDDAKGPDTPYRFDLGQKSRVRVTYHSDDFSPVVHVRRTCTDDQSEVGCFDTDSAVQDNEAVYTGILDPGSYTVFADSNDEAADGRFSLDAEVSPDGGGGAQGDACSDAVPLPIVDSTVDGDTFTAKDDMAGKCGGAGAADVVYRLDLPRRSRVVASFDKQEGISGGDGHIFVLQRTCADRASEIACGTTLDEILAPGTYYMTVDGAKPDRFGKFSIDWAVKDVSVQENACKSAPQIGDGQTVSGSTTGGADRFVTSCGTEHMGTSNDKVYKIVLASRQRVRVALTTPGFNGAVAIRKSCLDPSGASTARQAEVSCNNGAEDSHHSRIETSLEAGTYFIVVEGHRGGQEGTYTLEYKVVH